VACDSAATGSATGWFDLTTSNQLVGQKSAPSGSYAENRYYIYARRDTGSTQLILTIEFQDNDVGDPNIAKLVGTGEGGGGSGGHGPLHEMHCDAPAGAYWF
jgi:hypothetical protein